MNHSGIDVLLQHYSHALSTLPDAERLGVSARLFEHAENVLSSSVEPTISRPSLQLVVGACHRHLLRSGLGIDVIEDFDGWVRSASSVLGDASWKAIYFLLRCAQSDVSNAPFSFRPPDVSKPQLPLTDPKANTYPTAMESVNIDAMDERELLKDVLFPLQGSDGRLVVWNAEADSFQIRFGVKVSQHQRLIVSKLLQCGSHFRRLVVELSRFRAASHLTSTQRAFLEALHKELSDYYLRSVIDLEAWSLSDSSEITLFSMIHFTRDGLRRILYMRSLVKDVMLDESKSTTALLLNYLFNLSRSPVSFVQQPAKRLFAASLLPLWKSLQAWLLRGEVMSEFFVKLTGMTDWKHGFELDRAKLPQNLFDKTLIDKILTIGKTRRLFQFDCANPVLDACEPPHDLLFLSLAVDDLYSAINSFAFDRILNQHSLLGHLSAIKQFILFEQGDFCTLLLELLKDSLSRPSAHLYRMNLLSCLDTAVSLSSSFLKQYPQILENLDVKLIEAQLGWDTFSLDYRVPDHLMASVISSESMQEYSKMSHFSWNLRRVQFVLSSLHSKISLLHKHSTNGMRFLSNQFSKEYRGIERLLVLLINDMSSFVGGIQSNLGIALMQAWHQLEAALSNMSSKPSVEALIAVQDEYVNNLKVNFVLWNNSALKNKLGSLCSSILRVESLLNNLTSSNINETIAAVHASARQFQSDIDELIAVLNMEEIQRPNGDSLNFMDFADWNEYHRHRSGFDEQKFRLTHHSVLS